MISFTFTSLSNLHMLKPNIFFLFCLILLISRNVSTAQEKSQTAKNENFPAGKHLIGDNYGGGKIFWLDETGRHGLIAANTDQSPKGTAWNPGTLIATGANADGLYAGQQNSAKIASVQGTTNPGAASLCLSFKTTADNVEYKDWYLPSKSELNLLYKQKMVIGGFNITNGIYWSSTESSATPEASAWEQEFKYGSQYEDDKDLTDQVRCIRKF